MILRLKVFAGLAAEAAAASAQPGIWQGMKNTWNNAGTMKKIGIGGAALAGTYFLGKGLLGVNNNNNQ